MAWVISVVTILSMELTMRRLWHGWALSLFNQFLWLYYIFATSQWGLLPLNVMMWLQSFRGLRRWLRERQDDGRVTVR